MDSASQILWKEAGKPEPNKDVGTVESNFRCLTCGHDCKSMYPAKEAIPRTETGQDHFALHRSDVVCAGCWYVSKGRWKDQFRLWSIVYCEDGGLPDHYPSVYDQWGEDVGYDVRLQPLVENCDDRVQVTSRGDLSAAALIMMDPPKSKWFVSVAESGQKQVIRHAEVNVGDNYTVRFEVQDVDTDASTMRKLYRASTELKSDGWSNQDILTGQPSQSKMYKLKDKISRFHKIQEAIKKYQNTIQLELCLFSITEETIDDIGQAAARLYEGPALDAGGSTVHSQTSGMYTERSDRPEEILGLGTESNQSRRKKGGELREDAFSGISDTSDKGQGSTKKAKQVSLFNGGNP